MKKDIEWLVQMINAERETLRQRIETGRGTPNENTFNEGRDRALTYVLRMIQHLDKPAVSSQELPVIPRYVADWIKEEQGTMSNWKLPSRFISDSKYKKDQRRYKWSQVEDNMDKFMSALINSYEVEEEQKYCVNDGKNILLCKWISPDGWKVISTVESANHDLPFEELDFRLTEHEIKEYDPRYLEFRKSVDVELYDA